MLTWIITSGVIAGFSAAALQLFGESPESSPQNPQLQPLPNQRGRAAARRWARMTDAEIEALLQEFNR